MLNLDNNFAVPASDYIRLGITCFFRYYCGNQCEISDWPRYKEHKKSLEKNRRDMTHAVGSLVMNEDGVLDVAGSSSGRER
jgi:hypothetical protein